MKGEACKGNLRGLITPIPLQASLFCSYRQHLSGNPFRANPAANRRQGISGPFTLSHSYSISDSGRPVNRLARFFGKKFREVGSSGYGRYNE